MTSTEMEMPQQTVLEIGPYDPRSPIEILKSGETIKQENTRVSIDRIISEEAIVDASHVANMRESLSQRLGQQSVVVLRAREEEGEVIYDIIDGFHRTEAMRNLKIEEVKANVFYNITEEEFLDARIIATSVKSVQWPRIAKWVADEWKMTEWHNSGLSASQAFSLTFQDREGARGISTAQLTNIKEWTQAKCKKWGRKPKFISDILKVSSLAAPDLIENVRSSRPGKASASDLTPSRLWGIVEVFPGDENYDMQSFLVDLVLQHNLSARQSSELSKIIKSRLGSTQTISQVKAIADRAVVDVLKAKNNNSVEDDDDENEAYDDDGIYSTDEEETWTNRSAKSLSPNTPVVIEHARQSGGRKVERKPIKKYTPKKEHLNTGGMWWTTAAYIDQTEKEILADLFVRGVPVDQVAQKYDQDFNKLATTIMKALLKRQKANGGN